jgi:hypothetical protein
VEQGVTASGPGTRRRGQCDTCSHHHRLRKDGAIGGHRLFDAAGILAACAGAGKPPRPLQFTQGIPHCAECADYLFAGSAMLAEAVSSVAIENGRDPGQMLRDYIASYHERGHQEAE